MPRGLPLILVALIGCASPAPPQAAPRPAATRPPPPAKPSRIERSGGARIDIDIDGVDLTEVCRRIGALVGAPILVDPNLQETVTVALREIPWREAVEVIAKLARCRVERRPGGVLFLTSACRRVTICSDSVSAATVLRLCAAYLGREVVLPPGLDAAINGTLTGSPEDIFAEVLKRARLPYEAVWDDPIRLRPKSVIPLEPKLFELR